MKRETLYLEEKVVVGISVRTTNMDEMSPETAKIGALAARYREAAFSKQIDYKKRPGVTLNVYTEYESDAKGAYTFLIGEEVGRSEMQEGELVSKVIPKGKYQKFTTEKGPFPKVLIDAWQAIWQMSSEELGGERTFMSDFEVHDERSLNWEAAEIDLYIGVR